MTDSDPLQSLFRSRGWSLDMSPDAVLRRLRRVEELNEACRILASAERVADRSRRPVPPPAPRPDPP